MAVIVQLICSDKLYSKLVVELDRLQIDIDESAPLVLVERGFEVPNDKTCILFDGIDYVEVVKLLATGAAPDSHLKQSTTGFNDNRFYVLEPEGILYLEAQQDVIKAYTMNKDYSVKFTLQHYESLWQSKGFIRINKSQIVNLLHVKEIIPWFNSRYVLKLSNDLEVEVSKMYSKVLRNTLNI